MNSAQTRSWSIHRIIYRVFLHWALSGDLDLFYQSVRWTGWREEISSMNYDSVYSFYPFLWTEPQLSIDQRSRKTGLLINTGQFSLNLQHQLTNM
nr:MULTISPECIES: DUF2625 family protein [Providencia]